MIIEPHYPLIEDGRIFFEDHCTNTNSLQLAYDNLSKLIDEINSKLTPESKYLTQVQTVQTDLKSECSRCLNFKRIHGFGSSYNGFRSKSSDIDVVVELEEDGIDNQLIECKRMMERSCLFKLKDVVRGAVVPIITVEHIKTGLDCDISFSVPSINRTDVIWNTGLLKSYSKTYPEIAQAFRFFKHILNFTKFGSVRTGGLSTYGHIILFIYFLTQRRNPRIPLLNITTHRPDPNLSKPKLCAAQIVLDYLKFIACQIDSSKYSADIRTNQNVQRRKQYGSLGRLFIQDPYISKNLGKFMKEQNLYNFKVLCSRLLQYIVINGKPTRLSQLDDWCQDYHNRCKNMATPSLHSKCEPLYQGAANPKRKKTSPPMKTVMQTNELLTCTVERTQNGVTTTTSSTVNQLLCERTVNDQINLAWSDVLGTSFNDVTSTVDTTIPKLQCLVVFRRETDVERAELLLELMPCARELVVASCLTRRRGAHVYFTTYLNSVSKQTDVSSVKRIYIYNPTFQLPVSLWQILRDTVPGQLYFLISPPEVPNLTCEYIDKLARLFCHPSAESTYRYTLPIGDLKKALVQKDERFSDLPGNLEIHEIIS
ncbi:uncharacterized protein LOC134816567 isoform X2 [Bolinopsis microptera]|uniref:uncharacterized protein LOC134816567 isoform X2 n=1 Tax=Bolinopsis microptera TaxID=2820187 RepID=UPI00307A3D6E